MGREGGENVYVEKFSTIMRGVKKMEKQGNT